MTTKKIDESVNYALEIARIVEGLQLREVAQVYEFVVSLQAKSERAAFFAEEDDENWLNDSEEEMLTEDALWDEMFAHNAEMFDALAKAADVEIEMGLTQPMFDAGGELIIDELPHNA